MSNIAVAEILKIHGKWIEGKPFAEFVAEKKRITARQAYNLIKKASENRKILRLPLPNRTVLYGLAEFGPPDFKSSARGKTVNKYDEYTEELREIGKAGIVSADYAWHRLTLFTTTLPPRLKDKIQPILASTAENKSFSDSLALKIAIDQISTILYESLKGDSE